MKHWAEMGQVYFRYVSINSERPIICFFSSKIFLKQDLLSTANFKLSQKVDVVTILLKLPRKIFQNFNWPLCLLVI